MRALAQGVGEELRRRLEHPLIEQIDDRGIGLARRLRGEGPRQERQRAQIDGDGGSAELRAIEGRDVVGLELSPALLTRSVSGPNARRRDQPADLIVLREIGEHHRGAAARPRSRRDLFQASPREWKACTITA